MCRSNREVLSNGEDLSSNNMMSEGVVEVVGIKGGTMGGH
jgi:hypothetical protein